MNYIALVISVSVLSSCSGLTNVRNVARIDTIEMDPWQLFEDAGVTSTNCKSEGNSRADNAKELSCLVVEFEADGGDIDQRNAIIGSLIMASDVNCQAYFSNLRGFEITSGFTIGGLDSLVNAGGVAAGDLVTAKWLSGASTIFSTLDQKLDEAAFQSNSIMVIRGQVDRDRVTLREDLIARLNTDYEQWPLFDALASVFAYNEACSVTSGLIGLEKAAKDTERRTEVARNAAVKEAEKILEEVRAKVPDDPLVGEAFPFSKDDILDPAEVQARLNDSVSRALANEIRFR